MLGYLLQKPDSDSDSVCESDAERYTVLELSRQLTSATRICEFIMSYYVKV